MRLQHEACANVMGDVEPGNFPCVLQKTKGEDKKREVQAQLTQVQQQIREEESRRRRQAWEAGQKVGERMLLLLPHIPIAGASAGKPTALWC